LLAANKDWDALRVVVMEADVPRGTNFGVGTPRSHEDKEIEKIAAT